MRISYWSSYVCSSDLEFSTDGRLHYCTSASCPRGIHVDGRCRVRHHYRDAVHSSLLSTCGAARSFPPFRRARCSTDELLGAARGRERFLDDMARRLVGPVCSPAVLLDACDGCAPAFLRRHALQDRKSTRLNSSH